jgi:mono/diheme cytochrome c family protein
VLDTAIAKITEIIMKNFFIKLLFIVFGFSILLQDVADSAATVQQIKSFIKKDKKVFFAKDIAPFLFKNCASCHRAGQVATPLLTYEDARKHSKEIVEVISNRQMPI